MTKTNKIDWTGSAAVVLGAVGAALTYVLVLGVLFGPMAHAVVRLG